MPSRRSRRGAVLAAIAIVVVLAAAAVLFTLVPREPTLRTVTGSVGISDATGSSIERDSAGCKGAGGYADFESGGTVNVRDEQGTILGVGTLVHGAVVSATFLPLPADWATNASVNPLDFGEKLHSCSFEFSVTNVPDRSTFYTFEVGNRKGLTLSRDELAAQSWTVGIQLGS